MLSGGVGILGSGGGRVLGAQTRVRWSLVGEGTDGRREPATGIQPLQPACLHGLCLFHTHTHSGHCEHGDRLPGGHSQWGGGSMGRAKKMWGAEEEPLRSIMEDLLVEVACKLRPEGGVRRRWVKVKEVV